MNPSPSVSITVAALFAVAQLGIATQASAQGKSPRVVSERTVTGFIHPESVAYDPRAKVLYVGEFGSELKPTQKDGKGRISKVSLEGKVLEKQFLPAAGMTLDKPKGIWVQGNRLWVTDIDVVWVFDLKTKRGRKVALPGVQFANDPAVMGKALYVSDNRGDMLFKVEPADFLNMKGEPKVTQVFSERGVNPNGIYPARDGMLRMVGFVAPDKPRAIYGLGLSGQIKALSEDIGRLDGVYQMKDGSLLVTDWNSGSLFHWSEKGGMHKLATGFKGPADFCVVPSGTGLTVVVPDLVQSELRFVQLAP
jgi:sugar lactone lactonase YvrE